jgi:hypothetical protein
MNDLYLIGNGFDLAHGLKTSYNDFLLWYLKRSVSTFSPNKTLEDDLILVKRPYNNFLQDHSSLAELFAECEQFQISIEYKHDFFKHIVKGFREYRWVDIEYEYYTALVKLYKDLELNPHTRKSVLKELMQLNSCLNFIKRKLVEYLLSIKIFSSLANKQFEEILFEETGIPEAREREYFDRAFNGNGETTKEEKLFVSFNYTPTMECYLKNSTYENNLIYIHGELNGSSNPVIFGYGDEMDTHYEKIENLNNNEFLKNIKSFGYFRTNNYQQVNNFIEGDGKEFTVKILGHSCGLSDRILLNSIFEHPNCKAIKIYYYQKSETENDYFEKTQEISRHFKATGKGDMRTKIVPFSQSVPLIPFVPNN